MCSCRCLICCSARFVRTYILPGSTNSQYLPNLRMTVYRAKDIRILPIPLLFPVQSPRRAFVRYQVDCLSFVACKYYINAEYCMRETDRTEQRERDSLTSIYSMSPFHRDSKWMYCIHNHSMKEFNFVTSLTLQCVASQKICSNMLFCSPNLNSLCFWLFIVMDHNNSFVVEICRIANKI